MVRTHPPSLLLLACSIRCALHGIARNMSLCSPLFSSLNFNTLACCCGSGARELVLAVLSTPGPPQLTILGHLEQNDK
jgi:hypothetical protein